MKLIRNKSSDQGLPTYIVFGNVKIALPWTHLEPLRKILLSSNMSDSFNLEMLKRANRRDWSGIIESMSLPDMAKFWENKSLVQMRINVSVLDVFEDSGTHEDTEIDFCGGYVFDPVPGVYPDVAIIDWSHMPIDWVLGPIVARYSDELDSLYDTPNEIMVDGCTYKYV